SEEARCSASLHHLNRFGFPIHRPSPVAHRPSPIFPRNNQMLPASVYGVTLRPAWLGDRRGQMWQETISDWLEEAPHGTTREAALACRLRARAVQCTFLGSMLPARRQRFD